MGYNSHTFPTGSIQERGMLGICRCRSVYFAVLLLGVDNLSSGGDFIARRLS